MPRYLVIQYLKSLRRDEDRVDAVRVATTGQGESRRATAATAYVGGETLYGRRRVEGTVGRDRQGDLGVTLSDDDDDSSTAVLEFLGKGAQLFTGVPVYSRDHDVAFTRGVEFVGELGQLRLAQRRNFAFDVALSLKESLQRGHHVVQ